MRERWQRSGFLTASGHDSPQRGQHQGIPMPTKPPTRRRLPVASATILRGGLPWLVNGACPPARVPRSWHFLAADEATGVKSIANRRNSATASPCARCRRRSPAASWCSRRGRYPLRVVTGGIRALATDGLPTDPGMPACGWRLDNRQPAHAVTYSRGSQAPAAMPGNAARDARCNPMLDLLK